MARAKPRSGSGNQPGTTSPGERKEGIASRSDEGKRSSEQKLKKIGTDAFTPPLSLRGMGNLSPLPIAASRAVKLGGTVATVGFPNIGLQGFAPKLAKGEIASLSGAGARRSPAFGFR
jgi:hypothetical protein